MDKKRSLINPFEMLVLLLGIGVIVYVLYQNNGADLIKKTEQIEIIDNPKSSSKYTPKKPSIPEKRDQEIDQVLKALAHQFSERPKAAEEKKSQNTLDKLGLSKDEVKFYKEINDRYKFDDKIKNTQDWFAVLKTANSTYSKVKSLFRDSNQMAEVSTADSNETVLTEKGLPTSLTGQMKKLFKLKEKELQNFNQKGEKSISEWAAFILENQQ